MNKSDISKGVMEKVRFKKSQKERQRFLFPEFDYDVMPKKRADALVTSLFGIIAKALEKGEDVKISRFGQFLVKFKWARKGRDPKTGKPIILKSRRIVKFRYSLKLRQKINED